MDYYNFKDTTAENTIAHYAIWKQERTNKMYLTFVIHVDPSNKRAALLKSIDIISSRRLTTKEVDELRDAQGTRAFWCWYYSNIEQMISEDKKFNIETPKKFIDECIKRGFTEANQKKDKPIDLFSELE